MNVTSNIVNIKSITYEKESIEKNNQDKDNLCPTSPTTMMTNMNSKTIFALTI